MVEKADACGGADEAVCEASALESVVAVGDVVLARSSMGRGDCVTDADEVPELPAESGDDGSIPACVWSFPCGGEACEKPRGCGPRGEREGWSEERAELCTLVADEPGEMDSVSTSGLERGDGKMLEDADGDLNSGCGGRFAGVGCASSTAALPTPQGDASTSPSSSRKLPAGAR